MRQIRHRKDNYCIDPKRVIAKGFYAGGHLGEPAEARPQLFLDWGKL